MSKLRIGFALTGVALAGTSVPLMRWDRQFLTWLYLRPFELMSVAGFCSALGSLVVMVPIAVLMAAIMYRPGWSAQAFRTGGALALSIAVAEGLKLAIKRARPDSLPQTDFYGASFPSDHALSGLVLWFTMAIVLGELWPPGRTLLLSLAGVFAFLIGWSQVFLGVNWTADVLAAWGLGLLVLAALPPPGPPKAGRVKKAA